MNSASFRRNLAIAKESSKDVSPQQAPNIPRLNGVTFYKPAHSLGGDYYDFLPLQNGSCGIVIEDVSGERIGEPWS